MYTFLNLSGQSSFILGPGHNMQQSFYPGGPGPQGGNVDMFTRGYNSNPNSNFVSPSPTSNSLYVQNSQAGLSAPNMRQQFSPRGSFSSMNPSNAPSGGLMGAYDGLGSGLGNLQNHNPNMPGQPGHQQATMNNQGMQQSGGLGVSSMNGAGGGNRGLSFNQQQQDKNNNNYNNISNNSNNNNNANNNNNKSSSTSSPATGFIQMFSQKILPVMTGGVHRVASPNRTTTNNNNPAGGNNTSSTANQNQLQPQQYPAAAASGGGMSPSGMNRTVDLINFINFIKQPLMALSYPYEMSGHE